jgi:hypothetical protein
MELPELVRQRLGEETPDAAVKLGDDVALFTPSQMLLYRGEGLLSDESIDVYDHDIERLDISSGRRKTTVRLDYVDRTEEFTVPNDHAEDVLERLLDGVLGAAGVLDEGESVRGVYLFSELTLVVTDARLVKHIGAVVWDEDYEEFPFSEVTGLEFEEGSVATQIVISMQGRPQRIKAPNDEAPVLKQTLTEALCEFHDADSLAALNDALAPAETDEPARQSSDIFDDSIAPLVGTADDTADEGAAETADAETTDAETADERTTKTTDEGAPETTGSVISEESTAGESAQEREVADAADIERLHEQVSSLASAVERQNELLEEQREAILHLAKQIEESE